MNQHELYAKLGEKVIRLLYENQETGELDGEGTLPQDSCADFVQECEYWVSTLGLYPEDAE